MKSLKNILKWCWFLGLPIMFLVVAIALTMGLFLGHHGKDSIHSWLLGNNVDKDYAQTCVAMVIFWSISLLIWGNRIINWVKGRFTAVKVHVVDKTKDMLGKKEEKKPLSEETKAAIAEVVVPQKPIEEKKPEPKKNLIRGKL